MNKSTNIFCLNWPKISVNLIWIQKCIIKNYLKINYIKYVYFLKNCKFLFSPIWLGINLFIYFYNVVKMVIIHKKIVTFGYRQVV
jgi:hypothetical protein